MVHSTPSARGQHACRSFTSISTRATPLLLLADSYPWRLSPAPPRALLAQAAAKKLRLYAEFLEDLPSFNRSAPSDGCLPRSALHGSSAVANVSTHVRSLCACADSSAPASTVRYTGRLCGDSSAELLWTSQLVFEGVPQQHSKELCSLINAAIRDDRPELAAPTARVVRSVNTLCIVRGQDAAALAALEFPPGGRTVRGSSFDDQRDQRFLVTRCGCQRRRHMNGHMRSDDEIEPI